MPFAITLILSATMYRIIAVWNPGLVNFSPLMALAFCGAVYFRSARLWLVPFVALSLSDLYINHYYATQMGYSWDGVGAVTRTAGFAAALGLGLLVARRKNWLNLFSGALGGSVFFYLATNTVSWATDAFYAKTATGWWQALTVGHPEFAPTLFFFRNTFVSDLVFTGLFALAMEYAALRAGRPSLLGRNRETASVRA